MKNRECKPRRWLWFANGIIFTILLAGATAYFVPILDCPLCDPVKTEEADVGEIVGMSCSSCQSESKLTVMEYLQEFPVKVELPEVELPDLIGNEEADEKTDEPATDLKPEEDEE